MIRENKFVNEQLQVSISGNIYKEDAMEIRESFAALISNGQKLFVIDLSQVEYIDKYVLRTLVRIQKRVMQNGGNLIISGLNKRFKKQLALIRLIKIFDSQ